jgi:hypothetical protein
MNANKNHISLSGLPKHKNKAKWQVKVSKAELSCWKEV